MKIKVLIVGKTDEDWIDRGVEKYLKRLKHYVNIEFRYLPDLKNRKSLSKEEQKNKEGVLILKQLEASDILILFDEKGKEFSSLSFANYLQKRMNKGVKSITFVVGGPYGFSDVVYTRSNDKISLSKLTFSHQMIRPFIAEQIYRAYSILKNEPYHHQ